MKLFDNIIFDEYSSILDMYGEVYVLMMFKDIRGYKEIRKNISFNQILIELEQLEENNN